MSDSIEKEVSQDDIDGVKQLRSKYAQITAQIGQVEIELHVMKNQLEQLTSIREQLFESYSKLQTEEQDLVKQLNEKYGDGVLDLESNKFVASQTQN
jgi:chromosome segregation ATPase